MDDRKRYMGFITVAPIKSDTSSLLTLPGAKDLPMVVVDINELLAKYNNRIIELVIVDHGPLNMKKDKEDKHD